MSKTDSPYMRPKKAAEILGISETTIRSLWNSGQLHGRVINARGDRRISRESLMEFMQKCESPSKG